MAGNNSYEIVKATVEFADPPRLAIEDLAQPQNSDLVGVGFEPAIWQWRQVRPGLEECTDLFGCVRQRHDQGIGETHKPAIENWDDYDSFDLPEIELLEQHTRRELKALPPDKFVMGDVGQFVTKVFEIRGFENTLLDLGLNPDKVKSLAEKLTAFAIRRVAMYAEIGGIHCISIYDDWGTQQSMLLAPAQWRELFLDCYRELCDCARSHDMYVYFHSCGAVGPIITDMIEAGVNIINFDQPRLHGIAELGRDYAGKVTLSCPVDIQATLPTKDKDRIKTEACELAQHLHHQGGFIAKIYHGWADGTDGFDPAEYSRTVFQSIKTR